MSNSQFRVGSLIIPEAESLITFRHFKPTFIRVTIMATAFIMGGVWAAQAQAPTAEQGWEVCNKTSFILETAIAMPLADSVVVEGWVKIRPGGCKVVAAAPLPVGVSYIYAYSSEAHRRGRREWRGEFPLCVDPSSSFSTENSVDCEQWGMESRSFKPVKIANRRVWRTEFTETQTFDLERARNAGIQRLLDDAGEHYGPINGRIRGVTRLAMAEFLKKNELPDTISNADFIDVLEQAAKRRARNVGLDLCNRTKEKLWTAFARRTNQGWESRGWWGIEAGGCAHVVDEPLKNERYFVHAEMETPRGRRQLLRATDQFCVGRAPFVIVGRDDCENRAFKNEQFIGVQTADTQKLVFEFFDRDFGDLIED